MSVGACIAELTDDPECQSTTDLAAELLRTGRELAAAQCRWLTLLAEFDRRAGWAADGALSCVDWVAWRVGLARSTAKEKLRVAHEIRRRAIVRDAFAAGDVSYSQVRAITRVVDADATTDRRLLELAKVGSTADLERVVRHFEQLREQERGVDDYLRRFDRRSLRAARTFDGMMVIETVVPIEEGEELLRDVRVAEAVDKVLAETLSTGPGQRVSMRCSTSFEPAGVSSTLHRAPQIPIATRCTSLPTSTRSWIAPGELSSSTALRSASRRSAAWPVTAESSAIS